MDKATKEGGGVYHLGEGSSGYWGYWEVHPPFQIFRKRVLHRRKERKSQRKFSLSLDCIHVNILFFKNNFPPRPPPPFPYRKFLGPRLITYCK